MKLSTNKKTAKVSKYAKRNNQRSTHSLWMQLATIDYKFERKLYVNITNFWLEMPKC